MGKKVGLLLSGCGFQDGSEIYETVLSILALERAAAEIVAMAPDAAQRDVINHCTGKSEHQVRDVLRESARIVRGKINPVKEISADDLDALVIPGGFGVVTNLCNWAVEGAEPWVHPEVQRIINDINAQGKPIGAMCIAPVLVSMVLGDKNPTLTIGDDKNVANSIQSMGTKHQETTVDGIAIDERNKIVSTSAFMQAGKALDAEAGISAMVNKVLEMAVS